MPLRCAAWRAIPPLAEYEARCASGVTEPLPHPHHLQEGEELLCTRILHLGPAPAAGVGSSTAIDPSDYSPPTGGSVVLQPGVNRLVFK